MGSDESKPHDRKSDDQSSTITRRVSHPNQCSPWTLLHQCTLDQWKAGHAEAAGFSEPVLICEGIVHKDCSPTFCINRQGIINVNKASSIFSFRKRSKFTKMVEHFEYNHIPAQLSSIQNFHVRGVLCHSQYLIVLHLVRNMASQFGLIDVKANKFLGIFGKQHEEVLNIVLRGQLSPDNTRCLVKVPSATNESIQLKLYDLTSKAKAQLTTLQLHVDDSHFVFDPRFESSRLAITNFDAHLMSSLCLVRTDTWQILARNVSTFETSVLQELMYSPDGTLLLAVTMDNTCFCKERKRNIFQAINIAVYVMNADTADALHCIKYQRLTCAVHCCPINYLPLFSVCSNRMAISVNEQGNLLTPSVQVYKLPSALSLQHFCRIVVLQVYREHDIMELPLPLKLKKFLKFEPEFK